MRVLNRVTKSPIRHGHKLSASNPSKGSPRRRPSAHGPSFKPGDPVRESGIYEVLHGTEHRSPHEVVMLRGTLFPLCDTCDDQVRFRLIRTAPYIFQDDDFEEQE